MMNEFIMLNWYHYDLNYFIINTLRKFKSENKNFNTKKNLKDRMYLDNPLKIKRD